MRLPPFGQVLFRDWQHLNENDIRRILSDERWYGDGPPKWKNAPSSDATAQRRKKASSRLALADYQGQFPEASVLSLLIEQCAPGSRCMSAGCYECSRGMQRWIITAIRRLIRDQSPGYRDHAFNFVMPAGQAALGELNSVDFDGIMRTCRQAIDGTRVVEFAVLAFDNSLNIDTEKFSEGVYKIPPEIYWQVHIYGIIRTTDRLRVRQTLSDLYAENEKIRFPIKFRNDFDGSTKAISYLLKPEAFRRSAYHSPGYKCWTTAKPQALKPREQVEFLVESHKLGFARRIQLINLHPINTKATKTKKGGVALCKVMSRSMPCNR